MVPVWLCLRKVEYSSAPREDCASYEVYTRVNMIFTASSKQLSSRISDPPVSLITQVEDKSRSYLRRGYLLRVYRQLNVDIACEGASAG